MTETFKNTVNSKIGKLFIVATPIGNLGDITFRAIETLKDVDLILAEDTRHGGILLSHYGITTKTASLFEHNEISKISSVITKLKSGKNIAVISDAGTPCISDPGFKLIAQAVKDSVRVIPIPGVSSVTALLSVTGIQVDEFTYIGFMARKKGEMTAIFERIAARGGKFVFFESPRRIIKTLEEMEKKFYKCNVVLGREITKMFEEFIRGDLGEVLAILNSKPSIKGEIAVFIEVDPLVEDFNIESRIESLLDEGFKVKEISQMLSVQSDLNKSEIYKMVLQIKEVRDN